MTDRDRGGHLRQQTRTQVSLECAGIEYWHLLDGGSEVVFGVHFVEAERLRSRAYFSTVPGQFREYLLKIRDQICVTHLRERSSSNLLRTENRFLIPLRSVTFSEYAETFSIEMLVLNEP